MRVIIEKDTGEKEVFQDVSDIYLAIRQDIWVGKDARAFPTWKVHSFSWGGNVRELVKELQQSLVELQDFLRGQRNGGSQ